MTFLLSFLPRIWLQRALFRQWYRTLDRGQRVRVSYLGATGRGPEHHPFAWADKLKDSDR